MQPRSSIDGSPWGFGTIFLKGLALALPWGVIEDALTRYQHADAGYAVGLLAGLFCMYAIPPKSLALWRFLLLGVVMIAVHPILKLIFPKV